VYGSYLSELSIATIRDKVMKEPKIYGQALFATGKYQITPSTLTSAIKKIPGCNTDEPYGKEQQDALGLYIAIYRRKVLGKYLLGGKVRIESAQLQLAQEWASIHILEKTTRKGSKKQRVPGYSYRPDVELDKYQAYYANYQKYKWNKKTKDWDIQRDSNPDKANKARALKTKSALQKQRKDFSERADAAEIRKKLGFE
jgi:hypothetical protein